MKLSFLLEQARGGELAVFSDKDKTDKIIVSYINMALIALYNRFQLSTEEAIITLRPDLAKTLYTLDATDPDVRVGGQPMPEDDFKSIVYVLDDGGREVPVNNEKDLMSIFTTSYNQIQVPLLSEQTYLSVIYRRNPKLVAFVDAGDGKATEQTVDIPLQLLEPMLHYIGYRAHGAINGSIQAETSTHYTRYTAACDAIEKMGSLSSDDMAPTSVQEKGYV